jgi:hypothetical protein
MMVMWNAGNKVCFIIIFKNKHSNMATKAVMGNHFKILLTVRYNEELMQSQDLKKIAAATKIKNPHHALAVADVALMAYNSQFDSWGKAHHDFLCGFDIEHGDDAYFYVCDFMVEYYKELQSYAAITKADKTAKNGYIWLVKFEYCQTIEQMIEAIKFHRFDYRLAGKNLYASLEDCNLADSLMRPIFVED